MLYINDLNQVIKFCKVYHFADDTNLLYFGKSIKKLDKFVNVDLKNLVNWLNANETSQNVETTGMVIFKSKRKKFNDIVKIKLSGKRKFQDNINLEDILFISKSINLLPCLFSNWLVFFLRYTQI